LSLPVDAVAHLGEPLGDERLVAVGLERRQTFDLLTLGLGIDAQQIGDLERLLDELVDADDDVLLDPVALVVAERGLLKSRS